MLSPTVAIRMAIEFLTVWTEPDHAAAAVHITVWGPNWSSTSRDLGVFVYQPAEQITTSEANLGRRCRRW
jgi:hypothetical protein